MQPACLDLRGGASLSELQTPGIWITSAPSPQVARAYSVVVGISAHDEHNCPRISDEVSATLDGNAMDVVSRGEWHEAVISVGAGSWCDQARFALDDVPSTPIGTTSTVVVADHDMRWTIEVGALANDLTVDPRIPRGQDYELDVVWPSAMEEGSIQEVQANALPSDPSMPYWWSWWNESPNPDNNVTVTGNRIVLDVPERISGLELTATRTGMIEACTGPATCAFEADAEIFVGF